MKKTSHKRKKINTYFRQTASSLKGSKQAQIFSRIRRNIPYKLYTISKRKLTGKVAKINKKIEGHSLRFARKLKKS